MTKGYGDKARHYGIGYSSVCGQLNLLGTFRIACGRHLMSGNRYSMAPCCTVNAQRGWTITIIVLFRIKS